jgi:hypothetical protein
VQLNRLSSAAFDVDAGTPYLGVDVQARLRCSMVHFVRGTAEYDRELFSRCKDRLDFVRAIRVDRASCLCLSSPEQEALIADSMQLRGADGGKRGNGVRLTGVKTSCGLALGRIQI